MNHFLPIWMHRFPVSILPTRCRPPVQYSLVTARYIMVQKVRFRQTIGIQYGTARHSTSTVHCSTAQCAKVLGLLLPTHFPLRGAAPAEAHRPGHLHGGQEGGGQVRPADPVAGHDRPAEERHPAGPGCPPPPSVSSGQAPQGTPPPSPPPRLVKNSLFLASRFSRSRRGARAAPGAAVLPLDYHRRAEELAHRVLSPLAALAYGVYVYGVYVYTKDTLRHAGLAFAHPFPRKPVRAAVLVAWGGGQD